MLLKAKRTRVVEAAGAKDEQAATLQDGRGCHVLRRQLFLPYRALVVATNGARSQ